jgi:hypothetical protein
MVSMKMGVNRVFNLNMVLFSEFFKDIDQSNGIDTRRFSLRKNHIGETAFANPNK